MAATKRKSSAATQQKRNAATRARIIKLASLPIPKVTVISRADVMRHKAAWAETAKRAKVPVYPVQFFVEPRTGYITDSVHNSKLKADTFTGPCAFTMVNVRIEDIPAIPNPRIGNDHGTCMCGADRNEHDWDFNGDCEETNCEWFVPIRIK